MHKKKRGTDAERREAYRWAARVLRADPGPKAPVLTPGSVAERLIIIAALETTAKGGSHDD